MSYSPEIIANFFLDKASAEGRALTPMQLLKLVYIAHGWHLGYFNTPLISETVQAWKFGPVIGTIRDKTRIYGSGAVTEPLTTGPFPWMRDAQVSPATAPLLNSVWSSYSRFSGTQLSAMTHQPGTPWYQAWHDLAGKNQRGAVISNNLIHAHYKQKIVDMQSRQTAHA